MSNTENTPIVKRSKRALISVSDKSHLIEFSKSLIDLGYEIISSGGTYAALTSASVPAIEVKEVTGFPEILDGRVKTLHPKIHGGILSRGETDTDTLAKHGIQAIDLVVVNLYPFQKTIANPEVQLTDAIENIDIGGPTLIRAAAKNHHRVSVVVAPCDYDPLIEQLKTQKGKIPLSYRQTLAAKAFAHTAAYDAAICGYFSKEPKSNEQESLNPSTELPHHLVLPYQKVQNMRYGENPHQQAAFYKSTAIDVQTGFANANILQGKPLSYNNIVDADAALETVKSFQQSACVIVKHANPCGIAVRDSLKEAYLAAYETDPNSAFGGIIAFNQALDEETAQAILAKQFVEVIIAPSVADKALSLLSSKPNIRVLSMRSWESDQTSEPRLELKAVAGGLLVQSSDSQLTDPSTFEVVSKRKPTDAELADLIFAWKAVKYVKSNAIVYANQQQTIGIGAGQMSRVYSAKIASIKAADEGLTVKGCIMASDAFFPFRDTIDNAAKVGIRAVIQPGGSKRDSEVIAAANEHSMAMIFTHTRHFRH